LRNHGISFKEEIANLQAESLDRIRARLHGIEGRYSKRYFHQIFQLLPEPIRPDRRRAFKAYDGINNIFNLAYEMLSWKVHRAIVKAKLEPYLGFLHSLQHGKPSLVCDLQEVYRHLVDDFLVQYCRRLRKKDFTTKAKSVARNRKGKREYLNGGQTRQLMKQLNAFFEAIVEVPRIRIGKNQTIETLINEEALLFAKFLRDEQKTLTPRVAIL